MTQMQDALLKAGVITSKDITLRKAIEEKERIVARSKRRKEKKKKKPEKPTLETNGHPTYDKLNELFYTQKSKKFALRMINAYTPVSNAHFAWTDEDFTDGKECTMCTQQLVSKNDLLKKRVEISNEILTSIREELANEKSTDHAEAMKRALGGDYQLGIVAGETRVTFCPSCFDQFKLWMVNKLFANKDQTIVNIVNKRYKEGAFKN